MDKNDQLVPWPKTSAKAMEMEAEAERRRRAEVLQSEGDRQSEVNLAQGAACQKQYGLQRSF